MVVYLETTIEKQLARTQRDKKRPLLQVDAPPREVLEALALSLIHIFNHMRRVFLCAALRDQRLVGLLQLRLRRHVAILRFRGGGDIFHILSLIHI